MRPQILLQFHFVLSEPNNINNLLCFPWKLYAIILWLKFELTDTTWISTFNWFPQSFPQSFLFLWTAAFILNHVHFGPRFYFLFFIHFFPPSSFHVLFICLLSISYFFSSPFSYTKNKFFSSFLYLLRFHSIVHSASLCLPLFHSSPLFYNPPSFILRFVYFLLLIFLNSNLLSFLLFIYFLQTFYLFVPLFLSKCVSPLFLSPFNGSNFPLFLCTRFLLHKTTDCISYEMEYHTS